MNPEKFSPQSGVPEDAHENEQEKTADQKEAAAETPEKAVGKNQKEYIDGGDTISKDVSPLREHMKKEHVEKIEKMRKDKGEDGG